MRKIKTQFFIVRSIRMTNILVRQGFNILKVEDAEDNPKYKVFFFEDTPALQRAVSEYLSQDRGD